jgi:UDP-MurNAc hydroxylase
MNSYIKFINHASIVLGDKKHAVLTDPWYSGSAFDDGWLLLYENLKSDIINTLKKITHIWISHEHPDHFSIKFFQDYHKEIKNKTFIFQFTHDKRVVNFLKSKNLKYIEIRNGQEYKISKNFIIQIEKSDFYDSALIVKLHGKKIFNINDCPIKNENEILEFKKKYGTCDILLSQFSYAAWKGGKQNILWRKLAAIEKLQTLERQDRILESKLTIPFASFIYFANFFNFYLNDSINYPSKVIKYFKKNKKQILFLKPYQKVNLQQLKKNKNNFFYWEKKFKRLNSKKVIELDKSFDYEELKKFFDIYYNRIVRNNSILLLKIIRYLPLLNIFQPIIIKFLDTKQTVFVDIVNNTFKKTIIKPDILMNTKSIKLIFLQDFGFDTLTVNGCFEELKKNSFLKLAKTFSLGNLNNLGIRFNISFLLNFKMIFLFAKKLIFTQKKINYNYIKEIE